MDAHFEPQSQKYHGAYERQLQLFLSSIQNSTHQLEATSLTKVRHAHHRTLLPEYVGNERSRLYRLYFALLHLEENKSGTSSSIQKRINKAISLLASESKNPKEEYNRILNTHAAWLLVTLSQKREATMRYLMSRPKNATSNSVGPTDPVELSTRYPVRDAELRKFTLTEDALEELSHEPDSYQLTNRCQKYAKWIDIDTINYFRTHEKLQSWDDFSSLWKIDEIPSSSISLSLEKASQVMSIIKLHYTPGRIVENTPRSAEV